MIILYIQAFGWLLPPVIIASIFVFQKYAYKMYIFPIPIMQFNESVKRYHWTLEMTILTPQKVVSEIVVSFTPILGIIMLMVAIYFFLKIVIAFSCNGIVTVLERFFEV